MRVLAELVKKISWKIGLPSIVGMYIAGRIQLKRPR